MAAKVCGGSAVDKPTLCDIGDAEGRGLSIRLPTGGQRLKQPVPRVQATWATWHLVGRTALGGARARCRWSPQVCSCPVALVSRTFPDLLLEVVASDYSTLFSASAPRCVVSCCSLVQALLPPRKAVCEVRKQVCPTQLASSFLYLACSHQSDF